MRPTHKLDKSLFVSRRRYGMLTAAGVAVILLLSAVRLFPRDSGSSIVSLEQHFPSEATTAAETRLNQFDIIGGTIQEWGDLRKDERRTHYLEFVNRGESPVNVVRIARTCGCLNAVIVSPRIVKPNETGVIKVDVSGDPDSAGRKTYAVSALLEEGDGPSWAITFRTISEIYVRPSLVELGEIELQETAEGSVLLSHRLGDGLLIIGHDSLNGNIKLTNIAPETGGLRCYYALAALPPGEYEDELIIETSSTLDPQVRVLFKWSVASDIRISPPFVYFSVPDVQDTEGERTFWVESRNKNVFFISEIKYDQSALEIQPLQTEDEEQWRYGYIVSRTRPNSTFINREIVEIHTSEGILNLRVF